jgi:hypothetical protein
MFILSEQAAVQRVRAFVTMDYGAAPNPPMVATPQKDPHVAMATKSAFAQSAQVEHPKFGFGSVLSCNEEYIVIKFDEHGEKKFVLSIVLPNLKKSDRTPPVEKRRATRKKAVPAAS